MPAKEVSLEGIGPLKIFKRKGVRSIRLSIVGDGTIRVTQPRWLPYKAGLEFAQTRKKWIINNSKPARLLEHQQIIGKSYQLEFMPNQPVQNPTGRIKGHKIIIKLPSGMPVSAAKAQTAALRSVERALKIDTEELLVPRLKALAEKHEFSYRSVSVKKLKSRWGSCSQHKDIVLSSYLVQLPWNLIDYVLLHELQHTTVLAHGRDFWLALSNHVADVKQARQAIKTFQARVI